MRRAFAFAAVVTAAAPAWALDEYRDRRGLYTALVLGGGFATPGDDGEVGFRVGARVGGGMSRQLTADLGFDYGAIPEADMSTVGFDLAANYFPLEQIFLRGGAGMAALVPDQGKNDFGLGLILGVGIESFFGADLAGGFALTYEPEAYGGAIGTNHQMMGTVTVSWY